MDREKDLKEKLSGFSSNFDIFKEVKSLPRKYVKKKNEKFIGYSRPDQLMQLDTDMEKCRILNLVSLLSYSLGKPELALEYNTEAIALCEDNMVALCNKAWIFFYEQERYKDIEDILDKLSSMQHRKWQVLDAKAEVAYSLSKIGLPFYRRACEIYKGIIEEAQTKSFQEMQEELLLYWKFELAFTERRLLHINNTDLIGYSNIDIKNYAYVSELFLSITRTQGENQLLKRLKAKSFVQLGFLAYDAKKNRSLFPNGIKDLLPELRDWKTDKFFETALGIFPKDFFVLLKCGQFFRYSQDMESSITYLEQSIEIMETSTGHHHLALSLKRQLEMASEQFLAPRLPNDCTKRQFSYPRQGNPENTRIQSQRTDSFLHNTQKFKPPQNTQPHFSVGHYRTERKQLNSYLRQELDSINQILSNQKIASQESYPSSTGNTSTFSIYTRTQENPLNRGCNSYQRPNVIKQMIKSPKEVIKIDKQKEKATIDKILDHLNKSIQLNGNCAAMYDKGLLFRATGEPDKALEAFKIMMKDENQQCSPVQLSNAYEQAGLCIYDMLTGEDVGTDYKVNEALEKDMKVYFQYSIEISCRIVAEIPFLKDCWESAPTLQSFLAGKTKTKEQEKENLKDLANLFDKCGRYREAITVLKQLSELTEDEAQKAKLHHDIVKQYINAKQYDDAILTFGFIACLPSGYSSVDESLYLKAYFLGGIDVLRRGNKEMARPRFRTMLDFSKLLSVSQANTANFIGDNFSNDDDSKIKDTFDIFIVTSEDNEYAGRRLRKILKLFTLNTTVNLDSVIPGTRISEGFEGIVLNSKHAVVVCDENAQNEDYLVTIKDEFQKRGHGSVVVVTENSTPLIPKCLSACRKVEFEFSKHIVSEILVDNDEVCDKVKEILWKLTNTKSETM